MKKALVFAVGGAGLLCDVSQGGEYGLGNPVPRAQMRDMSTDRPDTTESAYTVDAGHYQIELSAVDFTYDNSDTAAGRRTRTWAVTPMLVKAGISENVDVQLGIDPYTRGTSRGGGEARESADGFGDMVVRTKFNLWGNDGGTTAGAIMPFVKFPTARRGLGNDKVEGGVILPMAIDLGGEVGAGIMTEFDVVHTGENERYTIDWVHTATLGMPLGEKAGCYLEYAGFANWSHAEKYRGYADAGFTYALTPDVQLDAGVRVGLTRAADDFGIFHGNFAEVLSSTRM